jgi:hypothetical protein
MKNWLMLVEWSNPEHWYADVESIGVVVSPTDSNKAASLALWLQFNYSTVFEMLWIGMSFKNTTVITLHSEIQIHMTSSTFQKRTLLIWDDEQWSGSVVQARLSGAIRGDGVLSLAKLHRWI